MARAAAGFISIGLAGANGPSKSQFEPSHSTRLLKLCHSRSCSLPKSQKHRNGGGTFVARKVKGIQATSAAAAEEIETSRARLNKHGKIAKPVLVIDNYDSFTYNLCQYLGDLGADFEVYRNDELTVEEMKGINPRGILISPGPGTPQDSGISLQTVVELGPTTPLFGVCMGLQCIGEAFGGKIVRSPYGVMHGKKSLVYYDEKGENGLLAGLPNPFTAGRYHSLVIEEESFPHDELEITAWTEDGLVMGIRHKKYKHIQGVQFHPESIITFEGKKIVQNFINMVECPDVHDASRCSLTGKRKSRWRSALTCFVQIGG